MTSSETTFERESGSSNELETGDENQNVSPIEEVRLTVVSDDDPTMPVWTFRMWSLGLISCILFSFLNTFFMYRTEPLIVSTISVQVATLAIGRFMERVLPATPFRVPWFGGTTASLNPGPFNMKEHVLISVFANAGVASGGSAAYAISIVDIIKAFYRRNISFWASWLLVITTQILGYGWTGILIKYVVDPAQMWWPSSLAQVSLFRALHEKDNDNMSRGKFFLIALFCSFSWYAVPGYLFPTLSTISWICWAYPRSVTAQQIGSGMKGLGIGSFSLDWSVIASYLGSPLSSPFFAIVNVAFGYIITMFILLPIAYWGLDLYNAKNFSIFSSHMFDAHGQIYNVSAIVNSQFEIDQEAYRRRGRINFSILFTLTYGIGFAAIVSTLTHVALFNGRDIYKQFRASYNTKEDAHTRSPMKKYRSIPSWWFHLILMVSIILSLALCIFKKDEIQMPWWGLIFAAGLAFIFTLPISVIIATTNQTPAGLNIIVEYIMGVILPGQPIANVCFKAYGYISMAQAISFLKVFKLGHYMMIPPISMFVVQCIGTIIAGTVNTGVAWWLLHTIENICQDQLLPPNSPWTCPSDRLFFDVSVLWGLVGPKRIFGYSHLNWFRFFFLSFLIGVMGPLLVWLLHKAFPSHKWITLINFPVILGATAMMPPATTVNFNCWIIVGTVFNFFVFRYRKQWWQKYNYVLSAALEAGVAFMGVLLYFSLTMKERSLSWWGADGEHCELAACPTAKGIVVDGCPVF